jgi:retron-type reverse transcriptase
VDADIKGFFDHVDHEWLIKFVKHRIADPNIHRLIVRLVNVRKLNVSEKTIINRQHLTFSGLPIIAARA